MNLEFFFPPILSGSQFPQPENGVAFAPCSSLQPHCCSSSRATDLELSHEPVCSQEAECCCFCLWTCKRSSGSLNGVFAKGLLLPW